jgi:hypothetical protein
LEALAVVGLIKLELFLALGLGNALPRLATLSFGGFVLNVVGSAFESDCFGPMLDPLELLLLAGIRVVDRGADGVEWLLLIVITGFFIVADTRDDEFETGDDASLVGILLTVFVDTALFSEEMELMRLERELLRFTKRCLFGTGAF